MNLIAFLGYALLFALGVGLSSLGQWLKQRRHNRAIADDYRSYNDELRNP